MGDGMATQAGGRITPVLLSGGEGSRLWPLSRETYPKQLLSVLGERTLLQEAALRVADRSLFVEPIVIADVQHRFMIGEQLRGVGLSGATIVLEPFAKGTAPAVATAALLAVRSDPGAMLLVMPVDHWVSDRAAFHAALSDGLAAAREGRFVLFGGSRTGEKQAGGVQVGSAVEAIPVVHYAASGPGDADLTAVGTCSGDGHGIFLLPASQLVDELEARAPDLLIACRAALAGATRDLDFLRLEEAAFGACPAASVESVMAQTGKAVVVDASFDWNHVGSWSELWSLGDKDSAGNVTVGDVVLEDSSGCYVRAEGQLVVALGVDDLVVTATPDAVLVTRRDRDQDVVKIVERLKTNGHRSATETLSVHRPWGYYQSIHAGERFQVKRITVNPGAKLSLQKHYHRAEHWVVVNGTAIVTRDDEEIMVRENESVFVPLGCTHRIENPGKVPLNLIEVQSGSYLGEDDIVRIQDIYHRV